MANTKTKFAVFSSVVASLLWIYNNLQFYNYGCVFGPAGSFCLAVWYNTNLNFFIPMILGEIIILVYAFLIWKFYSETKLKNRIVVTMSMLWGTWIFFLTTVLSPPPMYHCLECGSIGLPPIYALFWYGEISAFIVGLLLILVKPREGTSRI
jgi:hypothetical protein